jgi:hypothetical protein
MPTVKITAAKGLHQVTATTSEYAGSFFGNLSCVNPTVLQGVGALTASLADSGKTYVLGGDGGDTVFAIPEMTTAAIGWHAELIVTGALAATSIIQTVDSDGAAATSDRFLISLAQSDGGTTSDTLTTATHKLSFLTGCANATSAAVVKIRYIGANKAIVTGNVLT